jgi:hypothetical protein
MEPLIVSEKAREGGLQEIAALVLEEIEGLLTTMERAAERISCGCKLNEIEDAGYHLYLARKDPKDHGSRAEAVMSSMQYDRFIRIVESIAAQRGLCLEEETKLEIDLPLAEFEENMVTGGFERYKGLAVEHRNKCLEELISAVCQVLKERGLAVACVPDEDVIFYLPVAQSSDRMRK